VHTAAKQRRPARSSRAGVVATCCHEHPGHSYNTYFYNILYSLTKYLLYRVPHSNLMSRRLQSTAAVVQAGAIGLAEAACTRFGAATMTHKKASNLLKLLK
jgi:hypothetical protein